VDVSGVDCQELCRPHRGLVRPRAIRSHTLLDESRTPGHYDLDYLCVLERLVPQERPRYGFDCAPVSHYEILRRAPAVTEQRVSSFLRATYTRSHVAGTLVVRVHAETRRSATKHSLRNLPGEVPDYAILHAKNDTVARIHFWVEPLRVFVQQMPQAAAVDWRYGDVLKLHA